MYRYGLLRADDREGAEEHNDKLLGPNTLGLEVTNEGLAQKCGLGNIDPQHSREDRQQISAIERALNAPLPPNGACLVTIRPDRDSIGAMAVFKLRAEERDVDKFLVRGIGLMDTLGTGTAYKVHPKLMPERTIADALDAILFSGYVEELEEQVEYTAQILSREMSDGDIASIASLRNNTQPQSQGGDYRIEEYDGGLAFIEAPGDYRNARNWANSKYPVALIFDPEYTDRSGHTHKRYSLIRQDESFDRDMFDKVVNIKEAEARGMSPEELKFEGYDWGGPNNIVSSPQGRESALSAEEIVEIAKAVYASS